MYSADDLELENQRLRQMNQRLLDAVAFVGHEYSNQVMRLSITSEKLRRTEQYLNLTQRQLIEEIYSGLLALRLIARNYLDLARMEDAGVKFEPAFIDPLEDAILPVTVGYASLLSEHDITLELTIPEPTPIIWADPALLRTIFDNLISNAIKYGERGGKIVISVTETATEHHFSVWNSGPSIGLDDYLSTGFERFAHGSNASFGESNGIGLYLVRRIIEAHSGRLWVESQSGAWANFIFAIPKQR